jgi:hypothetical protein
MSESKRSSELQGNDHEDNAKVEKVEVYQDEVLHNPELMNDAFEGENAEHSMGAWEAAKKHPWACFWAFMMCFTIVSFPRSSMRCATMRNSGPHPGDHQLIPSFPIIGHGIFRHVLER